MLRVAHAGPGNAQLAQGALDGKHLNSNFQYFEVPEVRGFALFTCHFSFPVHAPPLCCELEQARTDVQRIRLSAMSPVR